MTMYHLLLQSSFEAFDNCRKACMSLRSKEQSKNLFCCGYYIDNVTRRRGNSTPFLGFGIKCFHNSSTANSSVVAAPEVSFDNSGREDQLASAAVTSEKYVFFMILIVFCNLRNEIVLFYWTAVAKTSLINMLLVYDC